MKINTEITDAYIAGKSVDFKRHWIFHSIVDGKYLYEEPDNIDWTRIDKLYQTIFSYISDFEPLNSCVWDSFFGCVQIPDSTRIYLIVGSPEPYDAMVRDDPDGNSCIILDLVRLASYSGDMINLSELVSRFVTHEIAHILVNNRYPTPPADASLFDILMHTVFDEGIAHFLSYKRNVLTTDWHTDEMNIRRKNSYRTLLSALDSDCEEKKEQIIMLSNSGDFWEKFAAIAGLFGVADYYECEGKERKAFTQLFERGPAFLFDFVLNQ